MEYAQSLCANLYSLRTSSQLCDFDIYPSPDSSELVRVHKIVLAASTPYFLSLLTAPSDLVIEDVGWTVPLDGVDIGMVWKLVQFLYTGRCELQMSWSAEE